MSKFYIRIEDKRHIEERANGRCEYCHCPVAFSPQPFVMEHIIPKSRGGASTLDNLAFSCQGCNGAKYTKTEVWNETLQVMIPLFNPRVHEWQEHFQWSDNTETLEAISQIGLVTIETLKLNRQEVVNLRRLLHQAGLHPSE